MSISPAYIALFGALFLALPVVAAPGGKVPCDAKVCGWHFYDDPPPPEAVAKPLTQPVLPPKRINSKLAAAEKFNQEMKDALTIAVYDPSPENVLAWSKMKTRLVQNADTMADVHQQLMWANPAMDFSVTGRPVSQVGMATFDQQRISQRRETVARLARTHVLYYFARSDCPYCKAFSPMLQAFGQATGLRVFAISIDGQPLPVFPQAQPDNGIAETLGVFSVPALFIADPAAGTITPIGYGAMSDEELFQRLDVITGPDAGKTSSATPLKAGARLVDPVPVDRIRPSRLNAATLLTGERP
jgi:conjugal transfer pilus assembly protein TraF